MSKPYKPPEAKIEKLVREQSPRQLAIAYLRASRRARNSEAAFEMLVSITDATDEVRNGNGEGASQKLKDAIRTARNLNETNEGSQS
ncbi:hypothetical protein [Roseovarius sp. MMSF_3281]|uniref:hypothetical protein n=1 Tax=Roseovarius sp. MMSF_3281 TaxID=3046694 RepID=UPI00273EE84F|nr:hypothetical protein [Roseovarius sp. MMSF_3281]